MKRLMSLLGAILVVFMVLSLVVACDTGVNPKDDGGGTDGDSTSGVEIPEGYIAVYLDTSVFEDDAERVHMHVNKRIDAVLHIEEIFGSETKAYKENRTLIQTFEEDEADDADYYWDRTISGVATIDDGCLVFTLVDAGDVYEYSGNIGAAGFGSAFIGMIVNETEWDALVAEAEAESSKAGAIRFEFADAYGAKDIAELFVR